MPVCLIGLGSNQGNRREILEAAVARLAKHPQIEPLAQSTWHETSAIGGPAEQPRFLNGALKLNTSLAPLPLLTYLQRVENQLGRRRSERWGPRTIDLDLLLYDEMVIDRPTLIVPHRQMAWRRFVLEPAAEVARTMIHPTIRWNIGQLLQHLNSTMPYVALTGPIAVGKTQLAKRLARVIFGRLIMEQPEWRLLEALYANPTGDAWETELQFLNDRARLLSSEATVWLDSKWIVSDFWFNQSKAFARTWLSPKQFRAFLIHYNLLHPKVVLPRLIVVLDAPIDVLISRVRERGRDCEQHLTEGQLECIRRAINLQAAAPKLGPVLHVANVNCDNAFAEVLTALQSTE